MERIPELAGFVRTPLMLLPYVNSFAENLINEVFPFDSGTLDLVFP